MVWFEAGACESVGIWLCGLISVPSCPIGHCAGADVDAKEEAFAVWSIGHLPAEVEGDAAEAAGV